MFVHPVKAKKNGKSGYYCTLVESVRVDGKPVHRNILSFGFITQDRLPYLKAAFCSGNPEDVLRDELKKLEDSEEKGNGKD